MKSRQEKYLGEQEVQFQATRLSLISYRLRTVCMVSRIPTLSHELFKHGNNFSYRMQTLSTWNIDILFGLKLKLL